MIRKYKLWFTFYGKKMKTTVIATSVEEAKEMVIENIKFDLVSSARTEDPKDFWEYISTLLNKFR